METGGCGPVASVEDEREKRKLLQYVKMIEKQQRKAMNKEKWKPENVKKAKNERIREAMMTSVADRENLLEPPVFYPTIEEMSDPVEYLESIYETGKKYGIVKIVMPNEYRLSDEDIKNPKLREDFAFKPRIQILGTAGDGFKYGEEVKLGAYCKEAAEHYKNYINPETDPDGSIDEVATERLFWSTLKNKSKATVKYGVDVDGTAVMDDADRMQDWSMRRLGMRNGTALKYVGCDMPGVTSPFYYIGMLFSMFCWHNEDNYLYSMSMLHAGAVKTWYGVPGDCADLFVERTRHLCRAEVFHKCQMILPEKIKKAGVPIYRTHQKPGEAVITFPGAFHAGFSHGFTVAEAVNFGLFNWLKENRRSVVDYRTKLGGRKYPIICHEEFMLRILDAVAAGDVVKTSHLQQVLTEAVCVFRYLSELEEKLDSAISSGSVKVFSGAAESNRCAILQHAAGTNQNLECARCGNTCFAGTIRCVNGGASKCKLYRNSLPICVACFVEGPRLCSCPNHVFGVIYDSGYIKTKLVEILESGIPIEDELDKHVRSHLADREGSQGTNEGTPTVTNGGSAASSDPKDHTTCKNESEGEDSAETRKATPKLSPRSVARLRAALGAPPSVEEIGEPMMMDLCQNMVGNPALNAESPTECQRGEEQAGRHMEATGCNAVNKEYVVDAEMPASLAALGSLYAEDSDDSEGDAESPKQPGESISKVGSDGLGDIEEARKIFLRGDESCAPSRDQGLHQSDNARFGRVECVQDERPGKPDVSKKEKKKAKALNGENKTASSRKRKVALPEFQLGLQTPYDGIEAKYPVYEVLRNSYRCVRNIYDDAIAESCFIPHAKQLHDWNEPGFVNTLLEMVNRGANMLKNVVVAHQWSQDVGASCRTATIETCCDNGGILVSVVEGLVRLREEGKGLMEGQLNELRQLNRAAAGYCLRLEQIKRVVSDSSLNGEAALRVLGQKAQTVMNPACRRKKRKVSDPQEI